MKIRSKNHIIVNGKRDVSINDLFKGVILFMHNEKSCIYNRN